jgi:hypothetical protein
VKNETFTPQDLIRFWFFNLEDVERRQLLSTFLYAFGNIQSNGLILVFILESVIDFVPIPALKRILRRLVGLLGLKDLIPQGLVLQDFNSVLGKSGISARGFINRVEFTARNREDG